MLRLGRSVLIQLISSSSASPVSQLHRLLSAAALLISPNPSFAVEEYLVGTCGLTRAQALKASTKLCHIKSPSKTDAVLAFLAGLGLSTADVAKDPQLLCASVESTLTPNVEGLTALGLSRAEIMLLALLAPGGIRCRSTASNLEYYLALFGSFENVLRAVKYNTCLLSYSLERTVKPNVAVLRECGLSDCDIAKLSIVVPRMLTNDLDFVRSIVACADGLGVPRGSLMFTHTLHAVAFLSKEMIAAKVEYLKNTFTWSDGEVRIAVSKFPTILTRSKHILQSRSEFLISEMGLEPAYIAHHPALLSYSLEGRLRPRYYVVKFLKENGLLDPKRSYYYAVMVTEKVFMH